MDVRIKAFQEATDTFTYFSHDSTWQNSNKNLGMNDSWMACKMAARKSSSTPPNCAGRRSSSSLKKKREW